MKKSELKSLIKECIEGNTAMNELRRLSKLSRERMIKLKEKDKKMG